MSATKAGLWARWKAWMARRSRVGRLCIRLLVFMAVAETMRSAGIGRGLDLAFLILCTIVLLPLLIVLLYRWVTRRVLWKVRNRLIVTYLLMGLAPVVLFGALGSVAAYLLAGQFATNMAHEALDEASISLRDEAASEALLSASEQLAPEMAGKVQHVSAFPGSRLQVSMKDGPLWRPLFVQGAKGAALPPPQLGQGTPSLELPFHGVVSYNGQLYLCSELSVPVGNHSALVVGSVPLDSAEAADLAKGLGTITIGGFSRGRTPKDEEDSDLSKPDAEEQAAAAKAAEAKGVGSDKARRNAPAVKPPQAPAVEAPQVDAAKDEDKGFSKVIGGKLPPSQHFFDYPVFFSAPLHIVSWETGATDDSFLSVVSRPTLLYAKLFESSVQAGTVVRVVLISIGAFFALLELFAVLMAMGLSRKITRSVADLYRGTKEIDAGNFDHRVRVAKHDQLGDLASSFNGMAASVSGLLLQQREQQRLLNELAIAQEVQTTLFPHSPAMLGGLEIHAVCLPARTVGGDYFDFIFGSHSGLCLALGDISGKGISAALLMASLHSAVRAFSLGQDEGEGLSLSPALLLKLLNRHLYLSTQSARYATLFLAFYDPKTRALTYSNGGHLPPLVLSLDGTVRRLDCGGSVVGLLEDLEYQEATVHLEPGDLVVAFTDGLTEPENAAGQEFGEPQLLGLIQHYREQPLPVLAGSTFGAVRAWIGEQEQPDDMTILLARQL